MTVTQDNLDDAIDILRKYANEWSERYVKEGEYEKSFDIEEALITISLHRLTAANAAEWVQNVRGAEQSVTLISQDEF